MERKDAIEIIKKNWPDSNFTVLREALETLIPELKESEDEKSPAETVKWSPQEENCICQLESLVKEQWRQAERVHNSVNIKKMLELMFFLKTLNPNKKPQRIISAEAKLYAKPAWSEEDEKNLRQTEYAVMKFFGGDCSLVGWLRKSLKEKAQPQNTWKPSDKQMEALEFVIKSLDNMFTAIGLMDNYTKPRLEEILEALKKLREE